MRGAAEDRIAAFENLGAALAVLRRLWELRLDDDVRREVTEAVQKLSVEQSRLHDRIQADKQAEKQLAARSEGAWTTYRTEEEQ